MEISVHYSCTLVHSQSRQSATLFPQSSESGLPLPLTRRWVCTSPHLWFRGAYSLGSGGVPIRTGKQTLCTLGICICALWVHVLRGFIGLYTVNVAPLQPGHFHYRPVCLLYVLSYINMMNNCHIYSSIWSHCVYSTYIPSTVCCRE